MMKNLNARTNRQMQTNAATARATQLHLQDIVCCQEGQESWTHHHEKSNNEEQGGHSDHSGGSTPPPNRAYTKPVGMIALVNLRP